MKRRDLYWLSAIVVIVAAAIWMARNPKFPVHPGLDLQGGLQVLLEADVPADQTVSTEDISTVRQVIGERVNGLGVTEPVVQVAGERRILVELPGLQDPDQAISLIQETALLEFVDTGTQSLPPGTCVRTSENNGQPSRCEQAGGTEPPTYNTVLTGDGLESATVQESRLREFYVAFKLKPDAAKTFEQFTSANKGKFLTIVLDKEVISSPRINDTISDAGTITGNFTLEEAQNLALKLRYGRLPVAMRVESVRQIGATLGEDSITASIRAGVIGVLIVLLFMLIYYRLPGVLADVALLIYALLNFAIFKTIGVTLTLPAITGFLFSTGMAVDANILVFERMKEELRHTVPLQEAVEAGFSRAWTSIRDSNLATLVICAILWFFGRNFGASTVQGFAITLALGVLVSLFTAVVVTHTFVRLVIGRSAERLKNRFWLLGL